MRPAIRELTRLADETIARSQKLVVDVRLWLKGRPTPAKPSPGVTVRPTRHMPVSTTNGRHMDENYVPSFAVPMDQKPSSLKD